MPNIPAISIILGIIRYTLSTIGSKKYFVGAVTPLIVASLIKPLSKAESIKGPKYIKSR